MHLDVRAEVGRQRPHPFAHLLDVSPGGWQVEQERRGHDLVAVPADRLAIRFAHVLVNVLEHAQLPSHPVTPAASPKSPVCRASCHRRSSKRYDDASDDVEASALSGACDDDALTLDLIQHADAPVRARPTAASISRAFSAGALPS